MLARGSVRQILFFVISIQGALCVYIDRGKPLGENVSACVMLCLREQECACVMLCSSVRRMRLRVQRYGKVRTFANPTPSTALKSVKGREYPLFSP